MSTRHFPIFHLVSPSSRSPREGQALPRHPAAPARKSRWSLLEQGLGPGFRQAKAQKEQGTCSGHTTGGHSSGVRQQLLSPGKTRGLGAGWQSLTLPSSRWTLCLPTNAVYHTGALGRHTRKIHDPQEVVGRKSQSWGRLGLSRFFPDAGPRW